MKTLIALLFVLLALVSCSKPQETTVKESEEEIIHVPEPEPEPITVSPLATTATLEPLESFSWEREQVPEYVMLHFTSAVVLSKTDPYNMETVRKIFEDNELSIHYIIDREGNIFSYIPEDRVAWHAGRGEFNGDEKYTNSMNHYAIGIELVAIGSENDMSQYLTPDEYASLDKSLIGFTDSQYNALKALVEDICTRNSIPRDREHVIGHDEYNPLKNDPGELFDWDRIIAKRYKKTAK